MLTELEKIISVDCLVQQAKPILLGVSGGPDSVFLLDILHQAGYQLIIAHLDHQLREESVQEAEYVEKIASQLSIPILIERLDVGAYAQRHKLSTEQAARQARYEFLFRQAEFSGAQAVAVGHTADDQIETVFLHLLRGSGLTGLAGMKYRSLPNPWSHTIPLIRPILGVWRNQILAYLASRPFNPQQDLSNWDETYLRNRIRHELIPFLENYNPQMRRNVFQLTNILQEDDEVLQEVANNAWTSCLLTQGAGHIQFNLFLLQQQPVAVQRRLVRKAFAALLNDLTDIEFQNIDQVIQFLNRPSRSSFSQLAAGLNISCEENTIFIFNEQAILPENHWPQMPCTEQRKLGIPGEFQLNKHWAIYCSLVDPNTETMETALKNQDQNLAWLDLDQIHLPLTLRCRQPGDRFQPLGLSGKTQKLSDFMINQKIPQRARSNWPLLVSQDEILWVPGYQTAHHTRLTSQTKKALFLQLIRK